MLLVFSLTGCGLGKDTAIKSSSTVISKALYQWFLIEGYDDALKNVDSTENLLNQKIEKKPATDWIKDRALYYAKLYITIEDMFQSLNLALTKDETLEIDNNVETYWKDSSYKSYYEGYGVDEKAFRKALENQTKENIVFNNYGEDLIDKVEEAQINDYYKEHCYLVKYMAIPYTRTAEATTSEGDSTETTVAEMDTASIYAGYKERALKGSESFDTLLDEVAAKEDYINAGFKVSETDSSKYSMFQDSASGLSAGFLEELKSAGTGKITAFADASSQYWIIYEKADILQIKTEYDTYASIVKEEIAKEAFSNQIDSWVNDKKITENKDITREQDLTKIFK